MRVKKTQGGLTVQAVVGDRAVFLGFDLTSDARKGCLGFALHRVDHTENESYWLAEFKTFRSVVPSPTSTATYPSNQHPLQSMWWGDHSAKPKHDYTYTIVPVYGTPAAPVVDQATSVSLDTATRDRTPAYTASTSTAESPPARPTPESNKADATPKTATFDSARDNTGHPHRAYPVRSISPARPSRRACPSEEVATR